MVNLWPLAILRFTNIRNKWSKSFDGNAASHVVPSLKFKDSTIPFAVHTATETPNVFQWVKQPYRIPIAVGDLEPIMVPWALQSEDDRVTEPRPQVTCTEN